MAELDLRPGDKVALATPMSERRFWWDVRVADKRFAVLTRQRPFKTLGIKIYTILDYELGIRGPVNLIGQGWDNEMPDHACTDLLAALNSGEVAVSRRNNIKTVIRRQQRVRPGWAEPGLRRTYGGGKPMEDPTGELRQRMLLDLERGTLCWQDDPAWVGCKHGVIPPEHPAVAEIMARRRKQARR